MSINSWNTDDKAPEVIKIWSDDLRNLEWRESVISNTEIVKCLVGILLKHPEIFPALFRLKMVCNNSNLENWTWVYSQYRLNGKNFPKDLITLEKDKSEWREIDFASKDAEVSQLIFTNRHALIDLLENWVEFNADKHVRRLLQKVSEYLVKWIDIDEQSLLRLKKAKEFAISEWKKLVLLANHISHLDAPILDYVLTQKLDIWLDPRFVCGAFMYYNRWVRPFTVWFNTLFVYWPKDFQKLISRVPSADRQLLKKFNSTVLSSFSEKPDKEMIVVFPYAGRSKEWEDADYIYWCKNKIPNWMKEMLSMEDCVYLPFWFNWTNSMFWPDRSWGGWNMLKNFKDSTPTNVSVFVWEHFVWWKKELSTIHDSMIFVSKNATQKRYLRCR
jgi:hypothetical protein